MAGRRFGWSRAALLQLILGVNLMVMPRTQARTLRFVTLVMRDGVAKGWPVLGGHRPAGGGRGGALLGSGVWSSGETTGLRGWGPGFAVFVTPWGFLGGGQGARSSVLEDR